MVPAFEGIAEDADRTAEAEYDRLGSMLYDDQIDMNDVADMAQDHGINVYETMSGVRQGVLNVKGGAKLDHRGGGKLDHPAVEWRG